MCLRLPILGCLQLWSLRTRGVRNSCARLSRQRVVCSRTTNQSRLLSLQRRPLLVQQVTAAWLRLDLQSHASLHHSTRWDSSGRGHTGPPSCSREGHLHGTCVVEASDALELARAVGVPTSLQLAWRLQHRPSWCQPEAASVAASPEQETPPPPLRVDFRSFHLPNDFAETGVRVLMSNTMLQVLRPVGCA